MWAVHKQVLVFWLSLLVATRASDEDLATQCLEDYASDVADILKQLQSLEYASENELNNRFSESFEQLEYKINSTKMYLLDQQSEAEKLGNTDKCDVEDKTWHQVEADFQKDGTILLNDLIGNIRKKNDELASAANGNEKKMEDLANKLIACVTESCISLIYVECKIDRGVFQASKIVESFTSFASEIDNKAVSEFNSLNETEEISLEEIIRSSMTCLFKQITEKFVEDFINDFDEKLSESIKMANGDFQNFTVEKLAFLEGEISNDTEEITTQISGASEDLDEDKEKAFNILNETILCDDYKKIFEKVLMDFENLTALMNKSFTNDIQRNLNLMEAELYSYGTQPDEFRNQLESCKKDDFDCIRNTYINCSIVATNLTEAIFKSRDKYIDLSSDLFKTTTGRLTKAFINIPLYIDRTASTSKYCLYDSTRDFVRKDLSLFTTVILGNCSKTQNVLVTNTYQIRNLAQNYSDNKYAELSKESYDMVQNGCSDIIESTLDEFSFNEKSGLNSLNLNLTYTTNDVIYDCGHLFQEISNDIEYCYNFNYTCLEDIEKRGNEIFANIPEYIADIIKKFETFSSDVLSKREHWTDVNFENCDKDLKSICNSGRAFIKEENLFIPMLMLILLSLKLNLII